MSTIVQTPSDWDCLKIGSAALVKRGASPRPIEDPKWWGGEIGWVRISDVTASRKYLRKTRDYLSDAGVRQSVKIDVGEVVLSICATIGRAIIITSPVCIHDGFVWFDGLSAEINREFFYYCLAGKEAEFQNGRQMGTQGNLNTTIVANTNLLIPQKPAEQTKIAEILSTVDRAIEQTEALIAKQQRIKTGLMQDLLTRGIDAAGKLRTEQTHAFKDSPLGRIPVEWEVMSIGEIFEIQLGKMLNQKASEGKSPFFYLGNRNVQWDFINTSELPVMDFNDDERKKYELRQGDILICEGGEVGRTSIWRGEVENCYYQKAIHRLRPTNGAYLPELFLRFMMWGVANGILADFTSQTSIAHLTQEKLAAVPIIVPPINDQVAILHVLAGFDANLNSNSANLKKLRTLKTALMQDLLTGRKRVTSLLDQAQVAV